MKQVWQATDGRVFATAEECEEYEKNSKEIDKLADRLYNETDIGCSFEAEDVAKWLHENFTLVPK